MFQAVYAPTSQSVQALRAGEILTFLYNHHTTHPDLVPEELRQRGDSPERMTVDYIAGMTDQFAVRIAEELRPGISGGVFAGVV